jgi:ankyrin repeat protein
MQSDYPPIFYAAAAGQLDRIRELGPGSSPEDLNQALAEACSLSQFEAADLLMEFGASADGLYHEAYGTVLFPACERLNPEGIRFLLKHGADPKRTVSRLDGPRDAFTHLLHSPFRSPLKGQCIQTLLGAGVIPPEDAETAIHRESLELLREALDKNPGALTAPLPSDYGLFPLQGASLLHLAVEFNLPELAEELIRRGLDINAVAEDVPGTASTEPVWPTRLVALGGQTPLFHARGYSRDMLKFLLERGADPKHKAPFLDEGKTVHLTALDLFQAIDDIECNLLEEILILRSV